MAYSSSAMEWEARLQARFASKIAVDSLLKYFQQLPRNKAHPRANDLSESMSKRAMALAEAIKFANTAIRKAACRHEGQAGMGSTVACVLVDENFFSVGHVGDSRVYLVRGGSIQQLTQDHSLVTRQVRLGLISSEQAKKSKLQNVITRALGSENTTVEPDLDDMMAVSDVVGTETHKDGKTVPFYVGRIERLAQASTNECINCAAEEFR